MSAPSSLARTPSTFPIPATVNLVPLWKSFFMVTHLFRSACAFSSLRAMVLYGMGGLCGACPLREEQRR